MVLLIGELCFFLLFNTFVGGRVRTIVLLSVET